MRQRRQEDNLERRDAVVLVPTALILLPVRRLDQRSVSFVLEKAFVKQRLQQARLHGIKDVWHIVPQVNVHHVKNNRFAVADAAQDGAPQVVGLDVVTAEQVDVVGVLHPCTSACLTNAYPRPSATLKYLKK